MIDNSFKMPKYEDKVYELLPTDTYQAELEEVEQITSTFKGEEKQQLKFTFRIIEDGKYYGRLQWMYGGLKLSGGTKPTNLFKILSGITGIAYDKEQCKKQDEWLTAEFLNGLIGSQVRLLVGSTEREDKTMTNKVQNILPAKTELPKFDKSKMENPL